MAVKPSSPKKGSQEEGPRDCGITDLKSFELVTGEKSDHQLAGLYFFCRLDFLIDLAYQVSMDFFNRPELFTDLTDENMPMILAKLHARYGSHEEFLDGKQRRVIFKAIFGSHSQTSMDDSQYDSYNFHRLSSELMDACAMFVETKFGDESSLRDAVRQAQSNFQQYLTARNGDSVRWSRENALASLTENITYTIFRNQGVSSRYGIAKSPTETWPYAPDPNGGKLVEALSKALNWPVSASKTHSHINSAIQGLSYISFDFVTNEQQVALKGACAITTAIDVDPNGPDSEINSLINRVYTWGKAEQKVRDYSKMHRRPAEPTVTEQPRGGIALAQPIPAPTEA